MSPSRHPATTGLAISIVFLAGLTAIGAWAGQDSDYSYYYYFEERRDLELDASRLAVLDRWSSAETAREDIESLFLAASVKAPQLIRENTRGWSLFQLSEASGSIELAGTSESRVGSLLSVLATLDLDGRFFFAPVFGQAPRTIYPTDSVLVRFQKDSDPSMVAEVLEAVGAGNMKREPLGQMPGGYRVSGGLGSGIESLQLANRLARRPEVVAAEVDMAFSAQPASVPNDPLFHNNSWGLHNIGQFGGTADIDIDGPEAWDRNTGDGSVMTMVIDNGIQQDHPDLHQLPGIDARGEGPYGGPVNQCDNHGTPVAGFIASIMDNAIGTAGTAPDSWVVSGRVLTANIPCGTGASTFTSDTILVLDWAESVGVRITNNSNYYDFSSSLIAARYQDTRDFGMIHFASAGNDNQGTIWYPASLPSVYAITAIDRHGDRAIFPQQGRASNWGPEAAFTGPGLTLASTDRTGNDGYTFYDYGIDFWGTSFSSPAIAGIAALLLSEAYSLDPDEVEQLLRESALDLGPPGWDPYFGWGLPNAADALNALDILEDDFESGGTSSWSRSVP